MKIRLAILEKDQNYLNRIVSVFSTKYADKFEIYSFTDATVAMNALEEVRIDVLIASDAYNVDIKSIPQRCGFAYLVDTADIDMLNDQYAICKFQKAELIYKKILSIYSENAGSITGLKIADSSCQIVAFSSISGGTGSSTMAAACALHFATIGKKVLYLNLEAFGSSDLFFSAEGQFDMSDIIFALKSKKQNLSLKLESCVKQDSRGVYFYSQPKIALDMLELNKDDILRLITELKLTGEYDYIVLDIDFGIDKGTLEIYRQTHSIVIVGDGSEISNTKIFRAYNALSTKEESADIPIINKIALVYNKFSNKTGKAIENVNIKSIGGAPRFEHATTAQVLQQLSAMNDVFDKVF